jgi:hypothetical protein
MSFSILADELSSTVEAAEPVLARRDDPEVSQPSLGRTWSPKQILGHLVDSAANNHQRFVRVQLVDHLRDPGYQQDEWVAVQGYDEVSWTELLALWKLYNRHLAHVIRRIPPDHAETVVQIGTSEPVSFGFLVEDYLRHLEHHLRQLGVPEQ